jgi:DNA-binding XRE family transcriptional regulator
MWMLSGEGWKHHQQTGLSVAQQPSAVVPTARSACETTPMRPHYIHKHAGYIAEMPLTYLTMERRLTTEGWEEVIGENVRRARFQADLSMRELAALADVSLGALGHLEHGRGATVKTLVRVARALGRSDWLNGLAPEVDVSPMRELRAQQKNKPQRRVRRSAI